MSKNKEFHLLKKILIMLIIIQAPIFAAGSLNDPSRTAHTAEEKQAEKVTGEKSPALAWSLSFFLIPAGALGIGQYYAESYSTAIPTTIVGLTGLSLLFGNTAKYGGEFNGGAAVGLGLYLAAWCFDWIYAIIATNRYNQRIRLRTQRPENQSLLHSENTFAHRNPNPLSLELSYRF